MKIIDEVLKSLGHYIAFKYTIVINWVQNLKDTIFNWNQILLILGLTLPT